MHDGEGKEDKGAVCGADSIGIGPGVGRHEPERAAVAAVEAEGRVRVRGERCSGVEDEVAGAEEPEEPGDTSSVIWFLPVNTLTAELHELLHLRQCPNRLFLNFNALLSKCSLNTLKKTQERCSPQFTSFSPLSLLFSIPVEL